ncbi:S26 family signal peptidase [Sphingomonas agri]|uniref:S26 family signal peptidase n=1 Tax=Sphingomonas agri TaxID=1813878 RepID=UPI00311FC834
MSRDGAARILSLGAVTLGMLALSGTAIIPKLLAWNASPSLREGLYLVEPWARPVTGELALARVPSRARQLAARRRYVPADVPLIKPVAAGEGDFVCGNGRAITINGRRAATRFRNDPGGRRMVWWSGCRKLGRGSLLLLAQAQRSFDGRYFGVSGSDEILGRALLLWGR